MKLSKRFLLITALVSVLVIGGITGVVVLADDTDTADQPQTACEQYLERVCQNYQEQTGITLDQEALREAAVQARNQMRDEALQNHLDRLVEDGVLTQEQADEYLDWWQSKPDIAIGQGPLGQGLMHNMRGQGPHGQGDCLATRDQLALTP
jgi:hypothetical protein